MDAAQRHTRNWGAIAIAVLSWIGGVGSPPPVEGAPVASGPGRIHGKVADKATGEPVAGASVFVLTGKLPSIRYRRTRSDADGRFDFTGLELGGYFLRVRARGFMEYVHGGRTKEPFALSITLTQAQPAAEVGIGLERGACLYGRVVDAGGQPVSRCNVFAFVRGDVPKRWKWRERGVGRTGADGRYAIDGLEHGHYVLMALLEPPATTRYGVEPLIAYHRDAFSPDEAKGVEVGKGSRLEGLDIRLRTTGGMVVTGKVMAAESGLPIAKAKVELQSRECFKHCIKTHTGVDGIYRFEIAGTGPYQVLADARGQGFARQSKWIDFAKGDGPKTVDLELDMGVSMSGSVVIEGDGPAPRVARMYGWVEPPRDRVMRATGFTIGNPRRIYTNGVITAMQNEMTYIQAGAQIEGMRVEKREGALRFSVRAACPGRSKIALLVAHTDYQVKAVEFEGMDLMRDPPSFQPGDEVDGIKITLSNR